MASLEPHTHEQHPSTANACPGLCRSADDVELLDKLTAFAAAANRGEVVKALDAINLAFAHGMFKCGTQRTSVSNRAGILSQCAQRFLGDLHASKISKDPRQLLTFVFNCGNYTQKHLRDAATAESKRALSTTKSFTRVPTPFCNERGLRKKLSCALYWHQDLIRAMLLVAREKPFLAALVRGHVRGVRYGIARQVQHYLEKLSDLCPKAGTAPSAHGVQILTIDGLYKWTQTYCRAWMSGFEEVEAEFLDILDPAMRASSTWAARAAAPDMMRMHDLVAAEASVAKDSLAETAADAVRSGMASKSVSGAVCGIFMTSAIKSQEENARLHSIVAAMRTDFGTQLQLATSQHAKKNLADARKEPSNTDSKWAARDCEAQSGDMHAAGGSNSTSQHRKQQSGRISVSRMRVAGTAAAGDDAVLNTRRPAECTGSKDGAGHRRQQAQQKRSHTGRGSGDADHKASFTKTASEESSTTSPMHVQQLEGTDSLLDADLQTLQRHAAADCDAAVDPFAASDMLASVPQISSPGSAQRAGHMDGRATHDSAFTIVQGDNPPGSSRLVCLQSAVFGAASGAGAQVTGHPGGEPACGGGAPPTPHAAAAGMHLQQQHSVAWQQQPLQQQGSQLAQCMPPWDQSSFMGASSFMSYATGYEATAAWTQSPIVHSMHTSPQQMHTPPHTASHHRTQSFPERKAPELLSCKSDMGPSMMHAYGGMHTGLQGAARMQWSPQPVGLAPPVQQPAAPHSLIPVQSLPAQAGNPFANAMTSGNALADMRSTSFAT